MILDKICQKQNIEPDKLLQNTYSSSYNEVVVRAKFAKLLGFFIKVYEDNDQPLNPEMAQIIRGKAKSLNLPVVEIKQPVKEIYSAGFDKDSNSYYINHGEYTIIIPIRNDESFYVYDRNGIGYFPDLDWVLEIFRLYKDKITDINENFVKEMYERQNTERLKLRVNFYKDGKIKSIYTKLGFGKKTQEYSISPAFKYTLSLNEEEIPFAHYRIEIGNEYERIRKANSGSPLELEEKVIGDFDENDKEDALKKLQEIEKVVLSKTQDNELIKKIQTFFEKIRREIKGEKQEEKQDLKNLLTPDFKKTDIDFSTLLNNLKNPKNK